LRNRANAANARRDRQRVLGWPPDQDLLETAIERRRHKGLPHGSGVDIERDLQIAFDAIERSDDDPAHLCFFAPGAGGNSSRSEREFSRTRLGVADFDSAARATNQALGISSGRPIGMPASFGVWRKPRVVSKPGEVQAMQVDPTWVQEPPPFQDRWLQSPTACVALQPRFSIRHPRSEKRSALALNS